MTARQAPRPPWLGRVILRLRLWRAGRSDIVSDLNDLFHRRAGERGRRYAARRYLRDAISLFGRRVTAPDLDQDAARLASRPRLWPAGLLADLAFAGRRFGRRAGTLALTVAGLAVAIGAATVVVGYVQAITVRPFGNNDPAAVVRLARATPNGGSSVWFPYKEFLELQQRSKHARLEASMRHQALLGDDGVQMVPVTLVSGTFFQTFGVRAAVGRVLGVADDQPAAPPVVIVGHGFWQRAFGGRRSIVGETVRLLGRPLTIVGVVEERFAGLVGHQPAFWAPLGLAAGDPAWQREPSWGLRVEVAGRLEEASARERAEAELTSVLIGLTAAPERAAPRAHLTPADERRRHPALPWLLSGLVLLLTVACANFANLLAAGASGRRREISLRLALGATRWRVARQLVTESILLAAIGSALGLVFALWFLPVLATLVELPVTIDVTPDVRVPAFATATALLIGVVAGVAPARRATRGDVSDPLRSQHGGPGRGGAGRTRALLVALQAGAAMVLLAFSALLIRQAGESSRVDLGFDPDPLVVITPNFSAARYDVARAADYWRRATERLAGIPGVAGAAVADLPPFALGAGYGPSRRVEREGRVEWVFLHRTSAAFFEASGMSVVRGRVYSEEEVAADAPVAVVSESLARSFWADGQAVGSTLAPVDGRRSGVRVIGVVSDAICNGLQLDQMRAAGMPPRSIFQPLPPDAALGGRLIVRTRGVAAGRLAPVLEAVRSLDSSVLPIARHVREAAREAAFGIVPQYAVIASLLAAVALALAASGVFAITAFVAAQRRPEIGVRLAVGATRASILRLMLRDSLRPVAAGGIVGLLAAVLSTHILAASLHDISARDPLSLLLAAAVLIVAASSAAALAGRRATRLDPVAVLRSD